AVDGSGTTEPAVGEHSYPADEVISITATSASGWDFVNWTGDVADPDSATTTVTMDSPKTVTANFELIPVTYTLTMAVDGSGTTEPAVGEHSYPADEVISITATSASGWDFVNWTGDVADPDSATTTVTMDSPKTVTANFELIPVTYTLTMAVDGSGTTEPAVGEHSYPADEVVSITATSASGWDFVNWTGDVADPDSATTTVTMDSPKTVTANFELIPPVDSFPIPLSAGWNTFSTPIALDPCTDTWDKLQEVSEL
ncbi:unnamed protein product, partial [marine sediment metagenome]